MKPISVVNAAPNAEREAGEGLELQLVSRKDSGSHETLSTRAANDQHAEIVREARASRVDGPCGYVKPGAVGESLRDRQATPAAFPANETLAPSSATRVANVPCPISSIEDRGARPYVAGLEVARPNEAAYSVRAPRNNPWLTPTLTSEEAEALREQIAAEGDRWVSSLQSVAIIYVFLFVLGWIGWNAHTISAWLYTHAQGIVGALLGGKP